ncbi:anti-repressor SinI family protein [Litchfieldia salsa]|nr:anti-repressor SinI family protein [Litchfieldia salsa]
MNNVAVGVENGLDIDWVVLILEAKKMGLSIKDVQSFLSEQAKK